MKKTKEIWKDVKGFGGDYEVSNYGRVRSNKNSRRKAKLDVDGNRIMNVKKTKTGFCRIGLYYKGKLRLKEVHILVAEAFVPNPEMHVHVNFKDGDKFNIYYENLEWSDRKKQAKSTRDSKGEFEEAKNLLIDESTSLANALNKLYKKKIMFVRLIEHAQEREADRWAIEVIGEEIRRLDSVIIQNIMTFKLKDLKK